MTLLRRGSTHGSDAGELGNVVPLADANGNVVERYIYDATGQVQAFTASVTPYNFGPGTGTAGQQLASSYDTPLNSNLTATATARSRAGSPPGTCPTPTPLRSPRRT